MVIIYILLTIISLGLLVQGAEWLIKGAVGIANIYKISKLAIASTLIAFGTGLPTIALNLALIFLSTNGVDAAVGNALGTNYVNIGLALGIPAYLVTIAAKYDVFEKEIPIYLAITSVFTAFALDSQIQFLEGLILVCSYFITLIVMYKYALKEKGSDKQSENNGEELDVNSSTVTDTQTKDLDFKASIMWVFVGLVTLLTFSILLAQLTPLLSSALHISEYILGITVLGIGTSLPTIVTSIRAAKKGYIDIVLGNVFGGTIANIALGIGLPALFRTLNFNAESVSDTYYFSILNIIVIFSVLIEMKLLGKSGTLNKISGVIIVGIYLIYFFSKLI